MGRIAEISKKRNENLTQVLKLVELPMEKYPITTFKIVSEEYKMKWYKRRIIRFAKNLGVTALFPVKSETVRFVCRDYGQALLICGCLDEETRKRIFKDLYGKNQQNS